VALLAPLCRKEQAGEIELVKYRNTQVEKGQQ